jgi:hypothetical protein
MQTIKTQIRKPNINIKRVLNQANIKQIHPNRQNKQFHIISNKPRANVVDK